MKKHKLVTIQRMPDLEEEERRREEMAERKEAMVARLEAALGGEGKGGAEAAGEEDEGGEEEGGSTEGGDTQGDEKAREVRRFLHLAVSSLDSYRSRLCVKDPESGRVEELAWLELVGATIRELSVGPRIQRLLFEIVTGLLPEDESYLKEMVADAAGLGATRTVSPAAIDRFRREGLLMAFVAKLFVDSKTLMVDGEPRDAESYFGEAADMARRLMSSEYLTHKDRVFLEKCRQRYGGDVVALVEAQRKTVLSGIEERRGDLASLEKALRKLVKEDYGVERIRPLDRWWGEIESAFSPKSYVYSKLDELRASVQKKIRSLENEELFDAEATAGRTGRQIQELAKKLNRTLKSKAGVEIQFENPQKIELFQLIREHADLLGRKDIVESFNAFVSNEELADLYARHKVAVFRGKRSDLRRQIRSSLYVWDEIFRSAPLPPELRQKIRDLRGELISYLESRGKRVGPDILEIPHTMPFAVATFELLATEDEFSVFKQWLEEIREVYEQASQLSRHVPFEKVHSLRSQEVAQPVPPLGEKAATLLWIPTGCVADAIRNTIPDPPPPPPPKTERRGGVFSWRVWPWNWFSRKSEP